jgi:hypothetical protein
MRSRRRRKKETSEVAGMNVHDVGGLVYCPVVEGRQPKIDFGRCVLMKKNCSGRMFTGRRQKSTVHAAWFETDVKLK